jgi:hypothetical protein
MVERAVHYLAIGHVAKDLTPGGHTLGGTVSFAALTALDLDYTPGVVTAHAGDIDLSPLADVPIAALDSPETTTFENIYSAAGRTQFLRARAVPLTAEAVPLNWLRAPIVHLGPLDREVDYDLATAFNGSFLGLTPQGWLRQWDAEGRVQPAVVDWPEAPQVLGHASAVVLSIDDLGGDWAVAEQWAKLTRVLVITQGPEGCTVFVRGQGVRTFRGSRQEEVDPTGAGDIFASAYFINYYETDDPWGSAKFANQMASLSVTRPGLAGVPTRAEAGYCRTRAALGG